MLNLFEHFLPSKRPIWSVLILNLLLTIHEQCTLTVKTFSKYFVIWIWKLNLNIFEVNSQQITTPMHQSPSRWVSTCSNWEESLFSSAAFCVTLKQIVTSYLADDVDCCMRVCMYLFWNHLEKKLHFLIQK